MGGPWLSRHVAERLPWQPRPRRDSEGAAGPNRHFLWRSRRAAEAEATSCKHCSEKRRSRSPGVRASSDHQRAVAACALATGLAS
ncbi:unnamed protein product [Lampetra planeri]